MVAQKLDGLCIVGTCWNIDYLPLISTLLIFSRIIGNTESFVPDTYLPHPPALRGLTKNTSPT